MNSKHKTTTLVLAGLTLWTASCAKDAPPPAVPSAPAQGPSADAILEQHPEKASIFSSIRISDRIREACGLTETETYFDFDSSRVSAQADKILTQLAQCFSTGPLSGEAMKLVGHADPRGDEEYNMVLGGKRADQVSNILQKKGLAKNRISTTSRGEMEAAGEDDAGWAKDRRVDVKIAG